MIYIARPVISTKEPGVAQTIVTTDDLDGSPDAEPFNFTWDGVNWTIDLAESNRKKLEDLLKPYLEKARPAQVAQPRSQPRQPAKSGIDYGTIDRAGEPHRGRVSPEEAKIVREQFDEVNKRLGVKGMRMLDPSDEKTRQRYGLE